MTSRHDYPELATAKPPAVVQVRCPLCAGSGWKETYIDDLGHGHGWKCTFCAGTGYILVEEDRHE